MGIEANAPWALGLLLPWLVYIFWMLKRTPRLNGKRKAAVLTTRAIIMLLLIAIAAGLHPYRSVEQRNIVFVADRSASMKGQAGLGEWIAEAWKGKSGNDFGAIISTGLHAVVDRPLTSDPLPNETAYHFKSSLNDRFTNVSKGMQLAAAMLKERGGGRIVLLSDGSENAGDALRQARLLKDAGIAVDVVHSASELQRDIAIEELHVPGMLKQGENTTFQLTIQSTFAGEAELRLFEDDRQLIVAKIQLERGENRFAVQSIAVEPGIRRYRAEIYAEGDEQAANNAAHAFSRVSGPPIALIVEGDPGSSGNIEAALTASLISHQTISPEQLSMELAEYAAYDTIILHNVPATRIAEKPMEWLSKAVGDYGVGLIMLGGEDSFGLGGYFHTPVERALPVYMDLQGRKQIPSLGLVLVIDRSGSMMDGKLELAKEAAMRTVELLRDVDTVGVVAFDASPWWVVEPIKLTEREEVIQKIQGIQADGGTEIYTALDAGYKGLLEIDAQRKHLILLTDGQSSTNMNYATITDAMNENLMTLSTVAVGEGADQSLLVRLAKDGKGRYYFTADQSTLPSIFSRETVLMSRTYVVDGTITPGVGGAIDWTFLWKQGLPQLRAYVATTPKEMAEVALWSPDGDPILARWTYGAGRSIAWTSDMTGKWAPDWTGWASFPNVFVEWVKWTFPQFDSFPYRITTSIEGSSGKLIVESTGDDFAQNSSSGGRLAAGILDSDGELKIKRLMPVSPGRYEADLHNLEPGAYLTQIGKLEGGTDQTSVSGSMTAGYVIPYSPEYRIGEGDGEELLTRIAALTGGRVLELDAAAESYNFQPMKWREPYDWTRELLIVALMLWLLDIALRRLSIPWQALQDRLRLMLRRQRDQIGQSPAPSSAAAASLAKMKQRAAEKSRFYGQSASTDSQLNNHSPPSPRPSISASPKKESDPAKPEQDNQTSVAKDATINRLLAAKNKKRR